MQDRILHHRLEPAHLLAISLRKLDHLVQARAIKVVKIGRRTLVPRTELERFAKRSTSQKPDGGSHAE